MSFNYSKAVVLAIVAACFATILLQGRNESGVLAFPLEARDVQPASTTTYPSPDSAAIEKRSSPPMFFLDGNDYRYKKLSKQGRHSESYALSDKFKGHAAIVKVVKDNEAGRIERDNTDKVGLLLHAEVQHGKIFMVQYNVREDYPEENDELMTFPELCKANPDMKNLRTYLKFKALVKEILVKIGEEHKLYYKNILMDTTFVDATLTKEKSAVIDWAPDDSDGDGNEGVLPASAYEGLDNKKWAMDITFALQNLDDDARDMGIDLPDSDSDSDSD